MFPAEPFRTNVGFKLKRWAEVAGGLGRSRVFGFTFYVLGFRFSIEVLFGFRYSGKGA